MVYRKGTCNGKIIHISRCFSCGSKRRRFKIYISWVIGITVHLIGIQKGDSVRTKAQISLFQKLNSKPNHWSILCAFNRTEILVLENLSGLGRLNLPLGATEPTLASGALCSKPIEMVTDGRFNRVLFLYLSGGNRLNWPTMRGGSTRVGQLS